MSLADIQRQQKDKPYPYVYYLARQRGYTHEEALNIAYGRARNQMKEQAIKEALANKQNREANKAADQARQDQYLIAGGTTGGLIGGPILADQIMSRGGQEVTKELAKETVANTAAQNSSSITGSGAASTSGGAYAVGTDAATGGTIMSDGSVVAPSTSSSFGEVAGTYGPYIPAAVAGTHLLPGLVNIARGKDNKKRYADATYDALTIGANFIPVVGPFVSAGMGMFRKPGMELMEKGFGVSQTKVEEERIRMLLASGLITEEQAAVMFGSRYNPDGSSTFTQRGQDEQLKEALAAGAKPNYIGYDDNGKWSNTAFLANKGDESFLAPEDVWGYSANTEAYNDWLNVPEWVRRAAAKEALAQGMYREHHGTVDINDPTAFSALVDEVLGTPDKYGAGSNYQPEAGLSAGGYYWDPIEHKYKKVGEKEVKDETEVDLNSPGIGKL